MPVKPNPIYRIMAEDVAMEWSARGWWVNCTPEHIMNLADDYLDLQKMRRSALEVKERVHCQSSHLMLRMVRWLFLV